jgi:hypothetical protein
MGFAMPCLAVPLPYHSRQYLPCVDRQYQHPRKLGLVTVAGKPGADLAPGTLNCISKQAGLKP